MTAIRLLVRATILAAGLSTASIAFSQAKRWDDPSDLPPIVQKAVRAALASRYSGERVIELREGPERFRNREIILKDGLKLRVEYGEGSRSFGQVVVERDRKRYHYFPDKNEIYVTPSHRDDVTARLIGSIKSAMRGNGKIAVTDGEPIAGYRTNKVTVTDGRGQTAQTLWIEPRTGIILKRELFDRSGAREGYFEFSRINLNPALRTEDFEPPKVAGAKTLMPDDVALQAMRRGGFVRLFLPEGPDLALEGSRVIGDGKILALHYRSPHGIISLMQVRGPIEPRLLAKTRRDGQNVFVWERAGRTFILIGPQPESQLRALSQRAQER